MELLNKLSWPLVRFIAPKYPEVNIFTKVKITPLGLVSVATVASKIWGMRVEIIDENNYIGPRQNGLPDHETLQKENPAAFVGFYCGLSSTIDRVFELAKFYRSCGVKNIAGGWHAHYNPDEMLTNNFDVVVHGDGEPVIAQILKAFLQKQGFSGVAGVSYLENNRKKTNSPDMLELPQLDDLPCPDFGLLHYAGKVSVYPIGRVRGCRFNCEFCSVKGKPRSCSPEHLFEVVQNLVQSRKAKHFFIVDDRLEENSDEILQFFRLIYERFGNELNFTVQIRLETARNLPLLAAMRKAGVRMACVGFESPIDEDLKTMHKAYTSRDMVALALTLRKYFWVHGMFIFGYPNQTESLLGAKEKAVRFKKFIRAARLSSVQILHPITLTGTQLRARIEKEGRNFPLNVVPWSKYDGNYAVFSPRDMTLKEFQETPIKLMRWFYPSLSFLKIPIWTLIFPLHFIFLGWNHWFYNWWREIVKYGGHRIIVQWNKNKENRKFFQRLSDYQKGMSA
ncbi:MAG TPA: radical SAM protein [Candidatus Methylomirabilis sp.]|nr:radical SAM protein [Candidatus Methylomirabilis sp.]